MKNFKRSTLAISVGLLISVGFTPLANAYDSLIILGSLGGTISNATGINDSGQVVGNSSTTGNDAYYATLWNGTTATDLGDPNGGNFSNATGINNSGQVVGWGSGFSGGSQAILWNATTPTILSPLYGEINSYATGINSSGQVVGLSVAGNSVAATQWNGTTATAINSGNLAGQLNQANGINDSGQVVGQYNSQATLWNGTAATVLGGYSSSANSINNSGQVVGVSRTTDGSAHATLWNGTTATDLGSLGVEGSDALSINNLGQVVGYSWPTTMVVPHATMWTMQNGTMVLTDLNTLIDPALGFTLMGANAINNNGQIVGYGLYNSQYGLPIQEAFVLTVPEPSEWLLMLSGFGLVGFVALRRKLDLATNMTFA